MTSVWKFRLAAARMFLSNREHRLALVVLILPRGWSLTKEKPRHVCSDVCADDNFACPNGCRDSVEA